mmetsp:Transcript_23299/g.50239  ORF Transcript_23299/g.50239 Transcript_23299/m.50239 type:complete len:204 (+) Transcript_23299:153-764(+)|eukprot:CAMPEP_0183352184 /NCGR_PEP_ID=MMETSP0164_2-20130417/28137_1 /TAXON_ID=221442 /ORGANISM="Coccolithus pelagicus ssp braarudi, Strain PLY182g" /LENGTH=203 /DNA_ID=CAMNT_0025524559 /DNA_START=113 /DNA_END=724 /DNA_ORIENTATION=-
MEGKAVVVGGPSSSGDLNLVVLRLKEGWCPVSLDFFLLQLERERLGELFGEDLLLELLLGVDSVLEVLLLLPAVGDESNDPLGVILETVEEGADREEGRLLLRPHLADWHLDDVVLALGQVRGDLRHTRAHLLAVDGDFASAALALTALVLDDLSCLDSDLAEPLARQSHGDLRLARLCKLDGDVANQPSLFEVAVRGTNRLT